MSARQQLNTLDKIFSEERIQSFVVVFWDPRRVFCLFCFLWIFVEGSAGGGGVDSASAARVLALFTEES